MRWGGRLVATASQASARIALFSSYISLASNPSLAWQTAQGMHHNSAISRPYAVATTSQSSLGFGVAADVSHRLAIRQAKPKNETHKLRVHNMCHKAVDLVLRYQDPQQNWATQGGFHLTGKQSRYLTSSSAHPIGLSGKILYYYGSSPNSDLVWSGNGSHQYLFGEQILDMRIHYGRLDVLGDYSLFILCASDVP